MKDLYRTQKLSAILAYGMFIALFFLPLLDTVIWFLTTTGNTFTLPTYWAANHPNVSAPVIHPILTANIWLGYLTNWLPLAIQLTGIWWLFKLFKNYARGEVFSLANVRYYRLLSYCLLAWFIVTPIHEALLLLALTFNKETVHIEFGLSAANFLALLAGALLFLISLIMEAAHAIEDENRLTI